MPEPRISIVVPTRDRTAGLERCLQALAAQTLSSQTEVVVVDDGSRDAAGVRRAAERNGAARVLSGTGSGPAAARNLGAKEARGEVLCLTDDDCVAEPDWAERLIARLDRGADVAIGRTLAVPSRRLDAASQHVANAFGELTRAGGTPFAATNNLACATAVLREVPFDERFPEAAGEDREWSVRLGEAGLVLAHEPTAVVRHDLGLDLLGFWRQHKRYGRGARAFAASRRGRGPAPSSLGLYPRLVGSAFTREGPAVGCLVCAAQVATAWGYATGARATNDNGRR